MMWKVKSEKRLHHNIPVCTAQLHTWQVITKLHFKTEIVCYGPNETIADFAVKQFSSIHLQTSQVIETVFSSNWSGFDP